MSQAANTGATKGRTAINAKEAKDAIQSAVKLGKLIYPSEPVTYACFYSQIPLNTNVICSCKAITPALTMRFRMIPPKRIFARESLMILRG